MMRRKSYVEKGGMMKRKRNDEEKKLHRERKIRIKESS